MNNISIKNRIWGVTFVYTNICLGNKADYFLAFAFANDKIKKWNKSIN